jgi:hypothetical protein
VYTSSAEKENWRTVPDMFSFRYFSDLWKEKLEWQNSRIGVFCTKAENWVGRTDWADIPFHV